jgi:outer membrane protein OmpA-like peptidoglycan-associated protein
MSSILDQAREAMTPDVVRSVGSLIGQNPSTTSKGLSAAIPSVLAGVTEMASTPSGAERVQGMISEGGYGGNTLSNLGGLLNGGATTSGLLRSGGHLLSSLFGSRETDVTDAVARAGGMPGSAASKLLAMVAPIVMAVIGREIGTRKLDGAGLTSLLAGERSVLSAPAATTLGSYRAVSEPIEREIPRSGFRWWPAVVAAGLAAIALLLFANRQKAPDVAVVGETVPSASPGPMASLQLPSGQKLEVRDGSFLQKFTVFLGDTSDTNLPKRFVFDDLTFETGTSALTPASQATVDQLAVILKAYPGVRVTVEGHTDSTGDAAANKTLSEDRAAAVKNRLVEKGGLGAERIAAAGYGQDRPLAPNDDEAGRARNRRTEVVVMSR